VRYLAVRASAIGSRPSFLSLPAPTYQQWPKPKTQANSPATTEIIGDRSGIGGIAELVMGAGAVALDSETYGERRSDGLDPWADDIRLLSLCVEGQDPWILGLHAIGYDLGELKTAIEAVEIIAHNAKFDLPWLRVKCGLRVSHAYFLHAGSRSLARRWHQARQRSRQVPGALPRHRACA
jgi:hypothetical protein